MLLGRGAAAYKLHTKKSEKKWQNKNKYKSKITIKEEMKKNGKHILVSNPRKWLKGHYRCYHHKIISISLGVMIPVIGCYHHHEGPN